MLHHDMLFRSSIDNFICSQIMYLSQAMIDCQTRMEHAYDYQEVLTLHKICTKLRESLSKAKAEKEHLQKFETKYLPTMDKLKKES